MTRLEIGAHAILLIEGLLAEEVPAPLEKFVARRYMHYLGRTEPTAIARIEFPSELAGEVAITLSESLKPREYYAHLVVRDRLLVCLPLQVAVVVRGDDDSVRAAVAAAGRFGIPEEYCSFRAMFEVDHPEMHETNGLEW